MAMRRMRNDANIEVRGNFRGILPEFMKTYIGSLGVRIQGDALLGIVGEPSFDIERSRWGQ